jgi:hypothetical protein
MSAVSVLAAGGIVRPADVVSIAAAADLKLAAAATLLVKESSGGRNVWGHDAVGRWEINCRVGFEILADHVRRRGVQDGFRAYNGSGPAAEAYGRDAKTRYDAWSVKLEENDMATADDIAAAVWRYGIRNGFGVTVEAQQILAAGEKRTADAQQALSALAAQVAHLRSAGVDDAAIRQAVGDGLDTAKS